MKAASTILLVDDEVDYRESLGEVLRSAGYDVLLAGSAPQALEMASRHKLALILLDVAMPGVDGIQLLRYFRSRHLFRYLPVILLTAGVRKESVQQALALGVRDVLLKSRFTTQELIDRIEARLVAPADMVRSPELAGSAAALHNPPSDPGFATATAPANPPQNTPSRDMVEAIGRLRALPRIVEEVLEVASRPDASLQDLEAVVRRDPVVVARLLQIVNSAEYARKISTLQLEEAVRALGVTTVIRVVAQSALLRPEDMEGQMGYDLWSIWRNSLAVATYVERLCQGTEKPAGYLIGLLHGLPSLFALQYLGEDWLLWRAHASVKGLPLHEALSLALGIPLESIAAQVLASYRIPSEISQPILEYHEFFLARKPREPGRMARRVDLAHQLAVAMGRSGTVFGQVRSVLVDEFRPFHPTEILLASDGELLSGHELESGLGGGADPMPTFSVPLRLWRDPRWAAPDPVEAILARCGDSTLVDRIEDLAGPEGSKLAIAEPGSPEWERLPSLAPVLVLHRAALPEGTDWPGVEFVRMPVSLAGLVRRVNRRI